MDYIMMISVCVYIYNNKCDGKRLVVVLFLELM